MNLSPYFAHHDWPMAESPAGRVVELVHAKRPELTPRACLEYARVALGQAAARKRYKIIVWSQAQEAGEQARRQKLRDVRAGKAGLDARRVLETRGMAIPERVTDHLGAHR